MRIRWITIMILIVFMAFVNVGVSQAAPDKLGGGTHIVQWGENLASIADRYGTTVAAIAQANGIVNTDYIYIGQQLVIPLLPGMNVPQAAGGPGGLGGPGVSPSASYMIRFGDTLTSIAARYGITVNELMQANGLNDSIIYIGQQVAIPGNGMGAVPVQAPAQMFPAQAQTSPYSVKPGDTLSAVAYRFGTTVNDIMQLNNLYNSMIFTGQQLAIPWGYAMGFDKPAGTYHTVQMGDTLAGLSLRYGTTLPAILQANNLSQSQFIFPGQELVIPGMMNQVTPPPMMMPGSPQNTIFPIGPVPNSAGNLPMSNPPMVQQPQFSQDMPYQAAPAGAPLIAPVLPGQSLTGAYQAPMIPMGPPPPAVSGVVMDNAPFVNPERSGPPDITTMWQGRLVSQAQPEDWKYPAVLRVNVGAAKGMQITVSKQGNNSWSTTGFTGTKPEYGDGAVEFAPLNPGKHVVSLDGQGKGSRMVVDIKPNSLTYVEFVKVRADTGPAS